MDWRQIQFGAMKLCIAGCQDQEKVNRVTHAACWSTAHTFFSSSDYGLGIGGNWYIEGVNIAGNFNRLVNRDSRYRFPLYMKEIYAEGLGSIGPWQGSNGDVLQDSSLDFEPPTLIGAYTSWLCVGTLTIRNSQLRYYGTNYRTTFNGIFNFDNCYFEEVPFVLSDQQTVGSLQGIGNVGYKNCSIGNISRILGPTEDRYCQPANFDTQFAYGKYRILADNSYLTGTQVWIDNDNPDPIMKMDINIAQGAASVIVSTGATNTAVVTFITAADANRVAVGGLVIINQNQVLGIVSAITGTTSFSVNYVPDGISSGNYAVQSIWTLRVLTFMGQTAQNVNTITGVVADKGTIANFISAGGACIIMGFYGNAKYLMQGRMLSYNSGTGVITMDRPATYFTTGPIWFSNCCLNKTINYLGFNAPLASEILPKGGIYSDNYTHVGGKRVFIGTGTGYMSGSPQATFTELSGVPAIPFAWIPATAPATANYTVVLTTANYITLSDLTGQANRNVILPTATAGAQLILRNINNSAFSWTPTGGPIKDPANNTVTVLSNNTTYQLVGDGSQWNVIN